MAIGSKNLDAVSLRERPDSELVEELREAKETLFNLRFQGATGQLESHGRLKAVRRDIARIYTVMRERELGILSVVENESDEKAGAATSSSSAAKSASAATSSSSAAKSASAGDAS